MAKTIKITFYNPKELWRMFFKTIDLKDEA